MFCNLWALLELIDTVMRGLDFRCSGRVEASYELEEQSERVCLSSCADRTVGCSCVEGKHLESNPDPSACPVGCRCLAL